MKPLAAIDLEPVAHRRADRIGDERRHAAGGLRDRWPSVVDEADGKILIFVDIGAEGGARDIRVDLIGDRDDAVADHFERDRVELGGSLRDGVHQCLSYLPPQSMRISPMVRS